MCLESRKSLFHIGIDVPAKEGFSEHEEIVAGIWTVSIPTVLVGRVVGSNRDSYLAAITTSGDACVADRSNNRAHGERERWSSVYSF